MIIETTDGVVQEEVAKVKFLVNGEAIHRVRPWRVPSEGDIWFTAGKEGETEVQGQLMEIETTLGDYKELCLATSTLVDDDNPCEGAKLVLPYSIESKPKGAPQGQVITITSVAVNPDDIADEYFAMPAKAAEGETAESGDYSPHENTAGPRAARLLFINGRGASPGGAGAPTGSAAPPLCSGESVMLAKRSIFLAIALVLGAVLGLVVGHGGLDRVLGEHGAMDLHRGECQLLCDVRVLDLTCLVQRLAFNPFGQQRTGGNCTAATIGFEHGIFNHAVITHLYLQSHNIPACRCADHAGTHIFLVLAERSDIARIFVMIQNFFTVSHFQPP